MTGQPSASPWLLPIRRGSRPTGATTRSLAPALASVLALHFVLEPLEVGPARLRVNQDGAVPLPRREHHIGRIFNAAGMLRILVLNRRHLARQHEGTARSVRD